jgi:hypothetical protein
MKNMNTIMRKAQRAILSMSIAILTAGIITVAAFAGGPYTRTEGTTTSQNLWRWGGTGTQTIQTLTSASCAGGYCGTLTQPTGGADDYYAWNMGTSNVNNIYHWCAYIPATLPKAAVRYGVWENQSTYYWDVLVNQANHKGQYVYLGFSDYPNANDASKYPTLSNECQSGYACAGYKVYFDTIKYTTYSTASPCQ